MKSIFNSLAHAINSRPYIVAGLLCAVFLIAIFGMTNVTMETGDDSYLDKGTPRGALLDHYADTFGSDSIMLIFETDDVTSPQTLEYIDLIEDDIRNERYVVSVSSIADLLKEANGGILPASVAEITELEEQMPPEMLEHYLLSKLMTIGVIQLQAGVSSNMQNQLLDSLDSLISISSPPPGLSVTVSGSPAFSKQMGTEIGSSTGMLILAAMLLMVVAVMLLFSHVRYPLLPVAVVASGLILTFGIMGIAGIPVSMTVVGAFPVLIGIGIDYAIQFHSRLDEEIQKSTLPQAVIKTVANSGPSVMLAMIATSLGFIAMFTSPVPSVADFGRTCTIGVVSCFFAALIVVPTFAHLVKYSPKHSPAKASSEPGREPLMLKYDRMLGRVAYKIAKNPVPVLLLFAFVAVIGLQLDGAVPISTDEDTFVPSDMPALVDMHKVTRTMGSTSTVPVRVAADDILSPDVLEWIKDFEDYELRNNDKITGVTSIVTLILQYNNGVMPGSEMEVREVLAEIPESRKSSYLNGNMEAMIEFNTVDMGSESAQSMVKNLKKDVVWYEPPAGVAVDVTGGTEMFAALMDDISDGKTTMTVVGFMMIIPFLLIVYRKFGAISPVIPIVMIVGWNGVIMYVLGLDYTPMTATLGSMTIGIASEYTILIMERCEEELATGVDVYTAIQTSVQKIGSAVTVSGMTTVFGFSALVLSSFNIISNFGLVTVISVGFSLLGAIIAMPAVISLMYRFSGTRNYGKNVDPAI